MSELVPSLENFVDQRRGLAFKPLAPVLNIGDLVPAEGANGPVDQLF